MKQTFTLFALAFTFSLFAQTTATFENFNVPVDSFLNGSDGSGGFTDGNIFLPNNFNTTYNSWTGWAISADTDTATPSFNNQYSVISGSGVDGSNTYAVTFISGQSTIELTGNAAGGVVEGFYINNGTYPFLSMRDGDNFAKKFGGATGGDPDFLLLTIKKSLDGQIGADSINFYLADYRDSDNTNDFILDEWTFVDLTSLGNVDELIFTISGTDIGQFGLNTPAYFCMDNLTTRDEVSSTNLINKLDVKVYPNPTTELLVIDWQEQPTIAQITNLFGQVFKTDFLQKGKNTLQVEHLPKGAYFLQVLTKEGVATQKFIKQ